MESASSIRILKGSEQKNLVNYLATIKENTIKHITFKQ